MRDGQFDYRAIESDGRVLDRDKLSDRALELLRRLDAGQTFTDEQSKRSFIGNLIFEDYQKLLTFMNGNLRELDPGDRSTDGDGIMVADYVPPRQEDKEGLLRQSFSAAQTMNEDGRYRYA